MRALVLILGLLSLAAPAWAIETYHDVAPGATDVTVTTGAEALPVLSVGALHGSRLLDRPVVVAASLTAPVFRLDGQHERLTLSARTPLQRWGAWRVDGRAGLGVQAFRSNLATGTGLLGEATVVGGWFGARGFVHLESTLALTPAVYVAPTPYYRDHHFSDAPSGWVRGAGGLWVLGLHGGLSVSDTVDVVSRVAVDSTLTGLGNRMVPIALHLGVNLHL